MDNPQRRLLLSIKYKTIKSVYSSIVSMGFIYLITDNTNGKQYVGQTVDTIQHRFQRGHIRSAKRLQRARDEKDTKYICYNEYFYGSMLSHGIENFSVQMIVEVNDDELDDMEIYFIKEYNTLRPNGYNLTSGGGHFRHHESTKKIMSDKAVAAAPALIDKYRKEETKGLPMYIVSHNKGKSKGFAVCGHPLCDYNSFTLVEYDSMETCKIEAIKFLDELVKNGVKYVPVMKSDPTLPIGMSPFRKGYIVKRKINGVLYKQTFEGKGRTLEQRRQDAQDYYDTLPIN